MSQFTLDTPFGRVPGEDVGNGVVRFLGIPYADPVERLDYSRLRSMKYDVERLGKRIGTLQPDSPITEKYEGTFKEFRVDIEELDKDGLVLNVWKLKNLNGLVPVMVYIHGGSLRDGCGAFPLYDGSVLAKKGVVLVTLNYRMNAMGFLTDPSTGKANFGLRDQLIGLEWIQKFIGLFGGDKDNVTVFGESAGAVSICYHVMTGKGKGLFHRAILQSGVSCSMPPFTGLEDTKLVRNATVIAGKVKQGFEGGYREALEVLKKAGGREVMQGILKAEQDFPPGTIGWSACIDGDYLKGDTMEMMLRGDNLDLSWLKGILMGDTEDEGTWFAEKWEIDTEEKMEGFLKVFVPFDEVRVKVKGLYKRLAGKLNGRSEAFMATSCFMGDMIFYYPIHLTARYLKRNGVEVGLYRYRYVASATREWNLGCLHSGELVSVFGVGGDGGDDEKVGEEMGRLWVEFAKDGKWGKDGEVLVIDSRMEWKREMELEGKQHDRLEFWASILTSS